jgi:hypothetical protein
MGWFGSKKVEEKPVETKVEKKVETKGDTPDNIIYQGPMSGMKEAVDKWNMENKR